jgi:nucleotide-binding universal stress UspA family protein
VFRTILVPLDGSPLAEQALPLALSVARRAQADLRLVMVHARHPGGPDPDIGASRSEQAYLDKVAARVRDTGGRPAATDVIPAATALIEEGSIAPALCGYARALQVGLIVLTTHGRGPLSRFWLGSVADELLRQATVPLLIHRPSADAPPGPDADHRFTRILVPLDGSETAEAVLGPAAELARLMDAELTLLRVVEGMPIVSPDGMVYVPPALDPELSKELVAQARDDLGRIAARLSGEGRRVDTRVVVQGSAVETILEAAQRADLVALATHGRGRVARLFLGSVADKVVRAAPCPVLVVRSHTSTGGPP